MRHAPTLLTALLVIAPQRQPAQQLGDRVRLTMRAAGSRRLEGMLISADADSVRLQVIDRSAPLSLAWSTVKRFEVSRGRGRAVGPGVRIGSPVGLGVGLIAGTTAARRANSQSCGTDFLSGVCRIRNGPLRTTQVLLDGGIGFFAGAVAGAAFGYVIRTERWERKAPGAPRLVIGPGGLSVGLSVAF